MLKLPNITKSTLLVSFFLLLTGCNDNATTVVETNLTASTESSQVTSMQENANGVKSLILTIEKTTLNKDENTTLKVMATYEDGTSKEVTDEVEWVVTPENSVVVTQKILIAKKDNPTILKAKLGNILSNSISLDITWIVNDYTLPPEPDKTLNDSTLLGIDVNGNGVRDDVERKIYLVFNKEIKRQYFMQEARHLQAMLRDKELIQNADAWQKKNNYNIACGSYLFRAHKVIRKLEDIQFIEESTLTTKDRLRKYLKYDRELSGGVYSVPNELRVESSCDFNVNEALKVDK